ncbi:hypothetical protein OAL43_03435, partial [bacterium]|nr:hypothetical protein [bacterium]
ITMKILFVKTSLVFPRSSGHDVHCFHMMKAMSEMGCDVHLVTNSTLYPGAIDGAGLKTAQTLAVGSPTADHTPGLTYLQERFRSFWGIEHHDIAEVGKPVSTLSWTN